MTGVAVASLLFTLVPQSPVWASQAPGEDDAAGGAAVGGMRLRHRVGLPAGADEGRALWLASGLRRGYVLNDQDGVGTFGGLVAVDLDSGEEVGRLQFPAHRRAWGGSQYTEGQPLSGAVDEAGQRLFVAYANPGLGLVAAFNPNTVQFRFGGWW